MKYKLQHALKNTDSMEQDWQEIENDDLDKLIDEIDGLNKTNHDWRMFKMCDFYRERDKTLHKNASAFTIGDSRIERSDLTWSIQSTDAYKEKNIDKCRDEFIVLYDAKKIKSTPL